jgi:uncharacterized repeat protein (TIGR01451 family)
MGLMKAVAVAAGILALSLPGPASAQATADLTVRVVGSPDPVRQNGVITFTITVTNLGPAQATNVALEASYGSDAQAVSATTTQGTCTPAGGFVDFSLGSIAPGGQVTTTVDVQTFRGDGDTLTGEVSSSSDDPNQFNDTASGSVSVEGKSPFRELSGSFCPPIGGVATGGGGTADRSEGWLTTFGMFAFASLVTAGVLRARR